MGYLCHFQNEKKITLIMWRVFNVTTTMGNSICSKTQLPYSLIDHTSHTDNNVHIQYKTKFYKAVFSKVSRRHVTWKLWNKPIMENDESLTYIYLLKNAVWILWSRYQTIVNSIRDWLSMPILYFTLKQILWTFSKLINCHLPILGLMFQSMYQH